MNINTARTMIETLSAGAFAGADWLGPKEAVIYFWCGFCRDTVPDFGLSPAYNSGPAKTEEVTVTDRHMLRALRKITA